MKLVLVSCHFQEHKGGIGISAFELCKALVTADQTITIDWLATANEQTDPCAIPRITRHQIPSWNIVESRFGITFPLWNPLSLGPLWRAIKQCDVVQLQEVLYPGNIVSFLIAKILRKPIVVTIQNGPPVGASRPTRLLYKILLFTVEKWILQGADRVIFISENLRQFFVGKAAYRQEPTVIENGVSTEQFHPVTARERTQLRKQKGLDDRKPVVLFCGRFSERKGLPLLRKLATALPGMQWLFVGWGNLRPNHWSLPNVYTIEGAPRTEIPSYFQAADLLVLPSYGEGLPLVIQEAIASGTPILTIDRNVISLPTSVHGINSIPDREREALSAWERAIITCMQQCPLREEKRTTLAQFGAARWNWTHTADAYLRMFRTIPSSSRGR